MRHPFIHSTILVLLVFLFSTSNILATPDKEGPLFKDVTITTSKDHLLLFGILTNTHDEELKQALHSGIPMEFTFFIELLKTKANSPDEELQTMEFSHILKYDPLKEIYQLEIGERKYKKSSYKSLDDAMQAMAEINGLKVLKLNRLLPDSSYVLRLKAELYKKTLPMNLHLLIPFVSMWNLETDWFTIEFTY
jgi:hypothetical protein